MDNAPAKFILTWTSGHIIQRIRGQIFRHPGATSEILGNVPTLSSNVRCRYIYCMDAASQIETLCSLGVRQYKIAERLGVTPGHLSRIKARERDASQHVLDDLKSMIDSRLEELRDISAAADSRNH